MHETFEFRVDSDFADRLFSAVEGTDLGSIRLISISPNDPRVARIGELQREIFRETGRAFFYGWDIRRSYTKNELAGAEAFKLRPIRTFEPPGELCGTVYDESTACPECGAGAMQLSDLRLDLRKAPKKSDIARTIANEIIISQRLAELLADVGTRGFELRPVRHEGADASDEISLDEIPIGRDILRRANSADAPHPSGRFWIWLNRAENSHLLNLAKEEWRSTRPGKRSAASNAAFVWHQLIATRLVQIVDPTSVGTNPVSIDKTGDSKCSRGDTIGLNLLSELSIARSDFADSEIARTVQYVGARRGVIRPEPLLVISARVWHALEARKIQGYRVEVAHLV